MAAQPRPMKRRLQPRKCPRGEHLEPGVARPETRLARTTAQERALRRRFQKASGVRRRAVYRTLQNVLTRVLRWGTGNRWAAGQRCDGGKESWDGRMNGVISSAERCRSPGSPSRGHLAAPHGAH
eukprot:scaffold3178_cov282-Pinguiococcus_pyrenoidosus.AAC.12